jgi:hypothetical protein
MKTLNINRAEELAQLIEQLPRHEILSSNPSVPGRGRGTNSHNYASCHQFVLEAGLGEILALDGQTKAVNF